MKLSKKPAAIAAAAALVGGLSACSSGTSGGSGDGTETVNLKWGFWDQGEAGNKTWKALADSVNEKYPNITVTETNPPFADYFTKLQSQLAGGSTPCIVSMQSLRLPAFAKAMEPLDEILKDAGFDASEWNQGALKALQYDGKQYALPYGISTMILYYNKDAFAKAGVPEPKAGWTIADFEDAAKKITAATGKPAFGQSFSDLHMFSMLLADNGAKPVSDQAQLQLTTPEMKDAFTWYSGLSTKQNVASVPASSSDIPWGEQQFVAGNVAMAVDGTWNLSSDASDATFNVGVAPLPQGPNGGGTYSANSGFGISKTCEHKEAAAKAILVLTGAEGAAQAAEGGSYPARTAQQDAFFKGLADKIDGKTPGFSEQAKAVMDASSAMATPFVSTDNWDQVTKEIARQFILSYTGSQSPEKTLENVQQAVG